MQLHDVPKEELDKIQKTQQSWTFINDRKETQESGQVNSLMEAPNIQRKELHWPLTHVNMMLV